MGFPSNASSVTAPVGLSDPQYLARRKSMFEFLTHVRALGCVPLPKFFAASRIPVLQSGCRTRHPCHRGHWLAERGEILPHRGDFWHHTPTCQRYLYSVSPSEATATGYPDVRNIDVRRNANSRTPRPHGRAKFLCS
jgi:hypothetical protein